jgi:membrane fusion protein, heavy metal efflux system
MKHRLSVAPILLASAIAVSACGSRGDRPSPTTQADSLLTVPPAQLAAMHIGMVTVRDTGLYRTISVPARLVTDPNQQAEVSSLLTGRIRDVRASFGDRVRKGAVLATVESPEFGELIAGVIGGRARAATATAAFERAKSLQSRNATSSRQLQESEAVAITAEAEFTAARQRLLAVGVPPADVAELLAHPDTYEPVLHIRAPIDGIVTERHASAGQRVGPDMVLFEILDPRTMYAEASVFDEDIPALQLRQQADFVTESVGDEPCACVLDYIGDVIDPETHALPVRARIRRTSPLLRPNLYGRLDIHTRMLDRIVSVPATAVVYDGTERYVFVPVDDHRFEYRRVETGRSFDISVEIRSGLRAGERVVGTGAFNLKSRLKLSQSAEE